MTNNKTSDRKPTARGRPEATRPAAYHWRLPDLMAQHGFRSTVELGPMLAERGVVLSDAQVYRLVHYVPERLGLKTLSALCDVFGCTPNDLVQPYVEGQRESLRAAGGGSTRRSATTTGGSELGRLPNDFTPVSANVLGSTKFRGR